MFGNFLSAGHSPSKNKSVYSKDQAIDLSKFHDLNDEFQLVSQYLVESLPLIIDLPFEGTNLKIASDERYFVFVSRQGRLAIIDSKEKVIVRDEPVADNQIWALGLSKDDRFIFVAGVDPVIKKYTFESLKLKQEFIGHTDEVNSIIISADDQWMFSCSDDNDVRLWNLNKKEGCDKVLYSHVGIVYYLDLSQDNKYLASGSSDCTAKIYELLWDQDLENGQLMNTIVLQSPIWAVKISPRNNFLVTGDQNGDIFLFSFLNWEHIKSFRADTRVRTIDVSQDENFIVTAGQDNKVTIWHLDKERDPIVMEEHTDMIKSAIITKDQNFIVSLADDKRFVRWKIPYFEDKVNIQNSEKIKELWGLDDRTVALTGSNLLSWDISGQLVQSVRLLDYTYFCSSKDYYLYLFTKVGENSTRITYKITEYNLRSFEASQEHKIRTTEIKSLCISPDRKYLCIGELYKISTFSINENMSLYNCQIYHDGEVLNMVLTPDNLYLFSAGEENEIKMIDTQKMKDAAIKNVVLEIKDLDTNNKIKGMVCTSDSSKLLIVASGVLLVWSIDQQSALKKVTLYKEVEKIYLSSIFDYFFLMSRDYIEVWKFKDFNPITGLKFDGLEHFALLNSEKNISLVYDNKLKCIESPLYSKHVKIIGEDVDKYMKDFLKYVNKIISGHTFDYDEKYDKKYEKWMIIPFFINIQHIYAYYDYSDLLTKAFLPDITDEYSGLAPFVISVNKHTPLSVSIHQDYDICTQVILKALKKRWPKDPYSLIYISDCLTQLNNMGIDGLQKLYQFSFRESFIKNLPSFARNVSLPIVCRSGSIETNCNSILGPNADTKDGSALIFENSYFKVNMGLGSTDSIEFMESILDCKNERIFETPFVQLILKEKWKYARYVMIGQALLYIGFLVTMAYYTTLEIGNNLFLLIPFIINILLLAYEGFQIYAGGLNYFEDVWNWVDLWRSSMFFIYSIMVWTSYFDDQSTFLSIIILVTWLRGVTYFRIITSTRYLINLLFEVFKDIPAFLIIFFYTIFAFSFIFYSIQSQSAFGYFNVLSVTYSTSLGNGDNSDYDKLQWLFYVLITLFNFIIMLNLLISILSDTYARIKENQTIADYKELASMILEVEMMLFWKKSMNEKEYIHVCRDENSTEIKADKFIVDKFKGINLKCNSYQEMIQNNHSKLQDINNSINMVNEEFQGLIKEVEEKFKLNE